MAVIDLVKWNANPSIVAWKFPSEELSTWTQLIVNESQEAYVVKEGVYQGPFGAGRHVLSTENIPLLRTLIGIPFGGKSPFTAEVWYINRVTNLEILWGTPDPIQLKDPEYQIMVPVRAFGQYGIKISDSKKFLLKLVGTLPGFDVETLSNYFRGIFTTKIKTNIAHAIIKNGQSVLEIATELETLSNILKETLAPEMDEYGVELAQFNIHSINVPEDDPAIKTLKSALARRTEMGLLGTNYQQQRSFDVLETAAGNEGSGAGVMSAGIGMGVGMGIGVPMGQTFSQVTPHMQMANLSGTPISCSNCGTSNNAGLKFCGNCGHNLSTVETKQPTLRCCQCDSIILPKSKFCPNCARKLHLCPECGSDNSETAQVCKSCHTALPTICPKCNFSIPKGGKFCPECGQKLISACSNCGEEINPTAKFCPSCGNAQ